MLHTIRVISILIVCVFSVQTNRYPYRYHYYYNRKGPYSRSQNYGNNLRPAWNWNNRAPRIIFPGPSSTSLEAHGGHVIFPEENSLTHDESFINNDDNIPNFFKESKGKL